MSRDDTGWVFSADPEVDAAERKGMAADWFDEAIRATGAVANVVAASLGVTPGRLARWRTDDRYAPVPLQAIIGLPPLARRRIVEELAALDGMVAVETPEPDALSTDVLREQAETLRQLADLFANLADARADGRIDRREADIIEPDAMAVAKKMLGIVEVCRIARRELVYGLPPVVIDGGRAKKKAK